MNRKKGPKNIQCPRSWVSLLPPSSTYIPHLVLPEQKSADMQDFCHKRGSFLGSQEIVIFVLYMFSCGAAFEKWRNAAGQTRGLVVIQFF